MPNRFFGSFDSAMDDGEVETVCGATNSSGFGSKRQR